MNKLLYVNFFLFTYLLNTKIQELRIDIQNKKWTHFFWRMEADFFWSYVIMKDICNKFIELKFSIGCMVWPWCRIFQIPRPCLFLIGLAKSIFFLTWEGIEHLLRFSHLYNGQGLCWLTKINAMWVSNKLHSTLNST